MFKKARSPARSRFGGARERQLACRPKLKRRLADFFNILLGDRLIIAGLDGSKALTMTFTRAKVG